MIYRQGKKHGNADALSRPPVDTIADINLISTLTKDGVDDYFISSKTLDEWENSHLLHFLEHGKHVSGASRKQVTRVNKIINNYQLSEINWKRMNQTC